MLKTWCFWPQTHISVLGVSTRSPRIGRQRPKHPKIWLGPALKLSGYREPPLHVALSALCEGSSRCHRSSPQSLGTCARHWVSTKTRSKQKRCSALVSRASSGAGPPADNGKQNGSKSRRKRTFASGLLGTGRPVPKGLQDDPYAAEKYWQDWESGLNGKTPGGRPPSDWDGWDAPGSGEGAPPTDYIRSRRALGRNEPRDEYIRPIIDSRGIRQRLSPQEDQTEDYLRDEFELNQWESRQSLKFSAVLIIVPLIIGFVVSRTLAEPTFVLMERFNPEFFELSDRQKVEGAHEVHVHELRLRMGSAIGRAPPLDDEEMWSELHHEAVEIQEQMIGRNKVAILNLVSDSTSALSLFGILVQDTEDRLMLFRTMGRIFSGLSDTAKAFIIIAVTDILLGYHSEEGWTAAIRMLTSHYGYETEESSIFIFVAIVPVTMDALFKYWIFKGLNRRNPAAAVTLRQMDRH